MHGGLARTLARIKNEALTCRVYVVYAWCVENITNYLSPHCTSGNCNFCTERRRRKAEQESLARQAANPCVSPWETKIGNSAGDIFGYWPLHGVPTMRQDPNVTFMKSAHAGGPKHRKVFRRHV